MKPKRNRKLGEKSYLNRQCWLAGTLGYSPAPRCRYCQLKFRECLFSQHLVVSLLLAAFLIGLSLIMEGRVSRLIVVAVFTLILVYGYFFSKSTERMIKMNYAEKKAKEALSKLNAELESRVDQRTDQLKQAYEELKILDRAKTEFLSIASHQLRTPLGAMRGYLSMMIKGDFGSLPPKAEKAAEEVYQASLRMIKLSNDLLSVSQIESGRAVLAYQKVDLAELISSVVDEIGVEAAKKGIDLRIGSKECRPLEADPGKARQIFLNIIDNALKYTEKGEVVVSVEECSPHHVLVRVEDTGAGLNAEDMKKIFGSFSRGRAGNNFHPGGTGLGLYVAKRFVDLHRGCLWAESAGRGKGSTFFVRLPRQRPGSKNT